MSYIKLPRTSTHDHWMCHVRVLSAVAEYLDHRPFQGKLERSGATVTLEALPCPAVLLEYAGHPKGAPRGDALWVLWTLDRERLAWVEVVRVQAADRSYLEAILPLARIAMRGPRRPAPQIPAIAARILQALDAELKDLPDEARMSVLYAVDPEIAGRMARYLI